MIFRPSGWTSSYPLSFFTYKKVVYGQTLHKNNLILPFVVYSCVQSLKYVKWFDTLRSSDETTDRHEKEKSRRELLLVSDLDTQKTRDKLL